MPEIKGLLAEARQELHALEDQVEFLARLVGEKPAPSTTATSAGKSASARGRKTPKRRVQKAAPSQERAVKALERAGRPMGPAELFRFMEAEGIERPGSVSALNAILWAASNTGRVVKAPGNVYTPPGGFPAGHSGTDDATVTTNGRSVPDDLPGTDKFAPPSAAQQASPNGSPPAGSEGREQSFEVGTR
jgi:hypothetical protein